MNGIGGITSLPPVTCVIENDIVKEMVPKIVEDVDTDNVTKINGIKSMQNSKTLNLQASKIGNFFFLPFLLSILLENFV